MIHLESDYNNGAHEAVLRNFLETNAERTQSYGDDRFSEQARTLIREACKAPDAQIWFLAGGTQTNATIIDCVLQPYEGVLCAETAHINVHEAGAVEFTGHKVITLPAHEGKLAVEDLQEWLKAYVVTRTETQIVVPEEPEADDKHEEIVMKETIRSYPASWLISFGTPITFLTRVNRLEQVHYAGEWDVLRPAKEVGGMNILAADQLAGLMREAETIIEGWKAS